MQEMSVDRVNILYEGRSGKQHKAVPPSDFKWYNVKL